jgi:phospholipid/cholesterol/gamma-HCH transport system substrate-binding protein
VVLTIYRKELIGPDIVAEKSIAGLSGGSYINLSPGRPAELEQSPKLKFSSRYPVIPSKPSEFGQILTDADKTMGSLKKFDFKGLSDQMKATARSMQNFVADPRMDHIKDHIEAMSAHLDATSRKIDNMVKEGDVKEVLDGTRQTLADTRELIAEMRREMKMMDLPGTTESAKRVIQGLDSRTSRISSDVRSAIDSLEETSDLLDRFIQRLNENPSDIIFSRPQPVRKD